MGEPRKVEVDLVDLKVLVETMFETDVRRQAEVMVLTQPGNSSAEAAFEFDREVSAATPEAQKMQGRLYRRLREALESGVDVASSLKSFVHRD
jgi:uncharacterized NAD-dependent epimerase/dehydratase family protein